MKIFKILAIIFLIYFIRRFIQMYRVMKALQENQNKGPQNPSEENPHMHKNTNDKDVVDADYKVID